MWQVALDEIELGRNALLEVASFFSHRTGTCLLYSAKHAATSFLSLFPYDTLSLYSAYHQRGSQLSLHDNPWHVLQQWMQPFDEQDFYPKWTGFLAYEMGAFSDEEKCPFLPRQDQLLAYFQRCCLLLVVDHTKNRATLLLDSEGLSFLGKEDRAWVQRLQGRQFWNCLSGNICLTASSLQQRGAFESLQGYQSKVEKAKEAIRAGDIYQVNLSQQLNFEGSFCPYSLFCRLMQSNPSPFAAYFQLPNATLISSSPEQFLQKKGKVLKTCPIKGTAPRGTSEEEDEANLKALLSSEKEKAELMMITDLMRNDLGRISLPGSVEVAKLLCFEKYSSVFHLFSVVCSKVCPQQHPLALLRACFPAGSITGCPKLQAMQVIWEIEKRPRGAYTGAIGYVSGNGDFDFNVAIRTLIAEDGCLDLQLGAGITIDSDPQQEFQETLHKGKAILRSLF